MKRCRPHLALALAALACDGPGLDRLWDLSPGGTAQAPAIAPSGILLTALRSAISGEIVLVAMEPATGAEIWSHPLDDLTAQPVVLDADGNVVISDEAGVAALDPDSGEEIWRLERPGYPWSLAVDAHSGTVYAQRLAGMEGEVVAVRAGEVRWLLPVHETARMAVGADGTLYLAFFTVQAVSPAGGLLWERELTGMVEDIALSRDHLLLTPGLTALSREDGTEVWTTGTLSGAEPIVGGDGTIYFSSAEGLAAISDATGAVIWTAATSSLEVALGQDDRLYGLAAVPDPDAPMDEDTSARCAVMSGSNGEILWYEEQGGTLVGSSGAPTFDGRRVYYAGGNSGARIVAFDGGPGLGDGPWPRTHADNGNRRQEQ